MNLADRLRVLLTGRTRAQALNDPRYGVSFGRLIPGSDIDPTPIDSKREAAETYAGWVFAASTFIAEEMRALEWSVKRQTSIRRDEWETDPRHPLNEILDAPNGSDSWGDFIERTTASFNVAGEAYWHIIRPNRRAEGLQTILPHWVDEPTFGRDGAQVGWRVSIPGYAPRELPIEDVIRIYRPHPLNPWMAASAVEAAAVSHYFDLYQRAYGMTLFRNDGGIPAGLLTTDQQLTPDQATSLREQWRQNYSQSRGEIAVLGEGTTYQPMAVPMKDLRFLETGEFTRDQILALFRVPSSVLGLSQDANRASSDAHLYSFQRHVLKPLSMRIEDAVNRRVLPAFATDNRRYWWGFESVVQKDRTAIRVEAKDSLESGAITINEYRQRLDMDTVPTGDVYLLPNTHRIADTLEAPQAPQEPQEPPPDPAEDAGARLILAAAARRAEKAEVEAAELRRAQAVEKRYRQLRGLFASWWANRDGQTIPMRGLDQYGLDVKDLPDVNDDEDTLGWIERLKGPAGKDLAVVSVDREAS